MVAWAEFTNVPGFFWKPRPPVYPWGKDIVRGKAGNTVSSHSNSFCAHAAMRLWDLPLSRAVLAMAQGISPFRHYIALSNMHHNRSKSFGYGTTGRAFNSFARCGCRDEVVKRHWQPCRLKNVRDTPRKLSHDCHGQPKLDYKFSFVNIVLLSGFVVRSIRESCLCRSSTSRERVWPKNFTNQARTLWQRAIWNTLLCCCCLRDRL